MLRTRDFTIIVFSEIRILYHNLSSKLLYWTLYTKNSGKPWGRLMNFTKQYKGERVQKKFSKLCQASQNSKQRY